MSKFTISDVINDLETRNSNQILKLYAVVGSVGETVKYVREGVQKFRLPVVLVEKGSRIMKRAICYTHENISHNFIVCRCILLTNIIYKESEFVVTHKSTVTKCSKYELSDELQNLCHRMLFPAESEITFVKDLKINEFVTMEGKVIQLYDAREIKINGDLVTIRDFQLEDGKKENVMVSLWANCASTHLSLGQSVKLSNMKVKIFNGKLSLNSTSRSVIKTTPCERISTFLTLIAIHKKAEKGYYVLTEEQMNIYFMPYSVLPDAYQPMSLDELDQELPLIFHVVLEGDTIISADTEEDLNI